MGVDVRSVAGRSRVLLLALTVSTAAATAGVLADLKERAVVSGILSRSGTPGAALRAAEDGRVFATQVQFLLLVFTAIVFIMWLFRVDGNVRAWGASDLPLAGWWTVGGWFIPIANLIIPGRVVHQVWAGSDPDLPSPVDDRWKRAGTNPVIVVWWVTFVAAALTSRVGAARISASVDLAELKGALSVAAISDALFVAAGIAGIAVVREITARQRARAGIILDRPLSAAFSSLGEAGQGSFLGDRSSGLDPVFESE